MVENTSGLPGDALYQNTLSQEERALRDLFVAEYMKDFDSYRAALRVGFIAAYAVQWSKLLMNDSYVQQEIARLTLSSTNCDAEDQDRADMALILNTYRYVMQQGGAAARVLAANSLRDMKGWKATEPTADKDAELADLFKDLAPRLPV